MDAARIKPELLGELLSGRDPNQLLESDGLLAELKKALAERGLKAEIHHHLAQHAEQTADNHRKGAEH